MPVFGQDCHDSLDRLQHGRRGRGRRVAPVLPTKILCRPEAEHYAYLRQDADGLILNGRLYNVAFTRTQDPGREAGRYATIHG